MRALLALLVFAPAIAWAGFAGGGTTLGNPAALNSVAVTGSQTITALSTPAAPTGTPSTTGGTVAASTTNYASIVALDSTGTVTGTQSAAVVTTGTTSSIAWVGTPVTGAVSYQFWFSTTSGTYTKYFSSSSASFTQTLPATSGTAGTFPTGNSTGVLRVPAGSSTKNAIQFGGNAGTGFSSLGVGNITTWSTLDVYGQFVSFGPSSMGAIANVNNGNTVTDPRNIVIASGFGTGASINSNGTWSAQVNVGTGGTASSGVLTFPVTGATGWICNVRYNGSSAGMDTYASTTSTASVTLTNQTSSTGGAVAWPAGTILNITCTGL
jgi:hypothetical protein